MIFVAYHIPCYGIGNKIYSEDGKGHHNKAEKIPVHNLNDLISQMYFFKMNLQLLNLIHEG